MLAVVAAIIFAIAFILRVTRTATDAVFAPDSLLLAAARRCRGCRRVRAAVLDPVPQLG